MDRDAGEIMKTAGSAARDTGYGRRTMPRITIDVDISDTGSQVGPAECEMRAGIKDE
jgi:hypothetical protein